MFAGRCEFKNWKIIKYKMEEVEKLKKENKKLKLGNRILTIYVILSIVIMLIDNHLFGLY